MRNCTLIIIVLMTLCFLQYVQSSIYNDLQFHLSWSRSKATPVELLESAKKWLGNKKPYRVNKFSTKQSPGDIIFDLDKAITLKRTTYCGEETFEYTQEVVDLSKKFPAKKSMAIALIDIANEKMERCAPHFNLVLDFSNRKNLDQYVNTLGRVICKESTPYETYKCLKEADTLNAERFAPAILELLKSIVGAEIFEAKVRGAGNEIYQELEVRQYVKTVFQSSCKAKRLYFVTYSGVETPSNVQKLLRYIELVKGHLPSGYNGEYLMKSEAYEHLCGQLVHSLNSLGGHISELVVKEYAEKN